MKTSRLVINEISVDTNYGEQDQITDKMLPCVYIIIYSGRDSSGTASSGGCSVSGMYIPSSFTINSNLCPFPKLNPSTTGLGNTITELVPNVVSVTVYLVGIMAKICDLFIFNTYARFVYTIMSQSGYVY
jgi:hypothetical protein